MELRKLKKQLKQELKTQEARKRKTNKTKIWLLLLIGLALCLGAYPFYQEYQQSAPERLLNKATSLENQGQIKEAEELYKSINEQFRGREEASTALYRVARIYQYDYQDVRNALVYYLQLEKDAPESNHIHTAREESAHIIKFSLRDYSQAIGFYQRLLSAGQGELDRYLYEIADCYFRLENYTQSRIELETLIEDFPDSPLVVDAMYRRGSLFVLEDRGEEARQSWQELVEAFPDSRYRVQVQFSLAKLLEEEDRLLEALEQYQQLENFSQPTMLNDKIRHLKERIEAKKEGDLMQKSIGVIGAGSWGTTLANLLAVKGHNVTLWCFEDALAMRMAKTHENDIYLPEIKLSTDLQVTNDLSAACTGKELILFVSPSQVTRTVLTSALPHIDPQAIIVSASKGIENDSLMLLSEVFEQILPASAHKQLGYLSGPSFAREVSLGMPTAVVAAAQDITVAEQIQDIFSTPGFRVYTHDDIIGVELGGAMKNVIAVAAGVSDGLGFGHNTRAALITRGLVEMTRLGLKLGGRAETFAGLAGMGDLVLTCTGDLSRNRSVGIELGKGRKIDDILSGMTMVAEGVKTTLSAYQLATRLEVDVPIIEQMYKILYQDKDPREAVSDLMLRDLKPEAV